MAMQIDQLLVSHATLLAFTAIAELHYCVRPLSAGRCRRADILRRIVAIRADDPRLSPLSTLYASVVPSIAATDLHKSLYPLRSVRHQPTAQRSCLCARPCRPRYSDPYQPAAL